MNLLIPAGLAFGAIIPIILILYFMRPKRQERVVGSTLLWREALQDIQASRPWQRLRVTPLLILQLLAAIAIVLILARPAIFASSPISGNTIIILQASASMQATDVAPNRFERAKNTIADLIDTMGPSDQLSLISMARTPRVLITQSRDKGQLYAALQQANVTNQDADLTSALSLATSLAATQPHAQILVVGDGHVMQPDQAIALPVPVSYMPVGTNAPNVALTALASRFIEKTFTVVANVANFSHQSRSVPVELYADGSLVSVQTVNLPAGANGSVTWTTVKPTAHILHARLLSQDAMSIDQDAWAIVGSSFHGRVLLVTKGNAFLLAALRSQPNVELFTIEPEKYSSTMSYDLTVFDGYAPPTLPEGNLLFVNPPEGNYLFGSSGPLSAISHINIGKDSINMLANVDLSSIHVVHASHQLQPALWAQTIINAPETPLLIAGENNNRRVAVLGFDLHDSDLPLQPAFPILMHNMTNWLLPPPIPENVTTTPGTPLSIQTWPGADRVTIIDPHNQSTVIGPPFPVNPYTKTDTIGVYQVTQHVHEHDLNGAFAINLFNANQSNLAPARQLPVVDSTNLLEDKNAIPRQLREIWPWVAAFLLLVLCAEWWLFSRNYKSQRTTTSGRQQEKRGGTRSETKDGGGARVGAVGIVPRADPTPTMIQLQNQVRQRYIRFKGQIRKIRRRLRGTRDRTTKGEKHVNI
jgi:Ca-activated chloride channel family protein